MYNPLSSPRSVERSIDQATVAMPHSFAAYSLQSTFDELQAQIQPVLSSWKSNRMMAVNSQFDKALLLVGGGWHGGELPLDFHDFHQVVGFELRDPPQKLERHRDRSAIHPQLSHASYELSRKILPW